MGAKRLFKTVAMKARLLLRRCADSDTGSGHLRARPRAFSSEVDTGSRRENATKQRIRAPFRLNRNGKGSSAMRGERGATMVEFALIMIPFFVILFGIFEVGFVFWGTFELENATADAARQIRTGHIRSNGGEAAFKNLVCSRVVLLSRCNADLRLDVRSFNSFSDLQNNPPAPLDNDGELKDSLTFSPGGPRSIVLVSTFYRWPLINALSSYSIANMAGGDRLLQASAAFRNEPFPDN
jgi:Flp pilus assembly protein TadG